MRGRSGCLWVVATPIGNLDDLSKRAIDVLGKVAIIAAEDTRRSAPLLARAGSRARVVAVHEHNEREQFAPLLERLAAGEDIALISDAGTPLI
ncbi:MAG: SAM-dependent methyltransferase, partial [Rhodanobacteraceae bacterium]